MEKTKEISREEFASKVEEVLHVLKNDLGIIKENMIAATIPDDVRSNIPIKSPIIPKLFTVSIAPWISKCPNEVIGTRAPPPAHKTNLSYMLKESRNAPTTTKIVVICPGVSLVLSRINCPITQTIPQNKNAFK